jgi:hypothetical protein
MAVSPNFLQQAVVRFKPPRAGSCLTPELLAELSSLIEVELIDSTSQVDMKASGDQNNLSAVAGDGGIFTPASLLYTDTLPFTGTQLTFTGWDQAIDARTAFLNVFPIFSTTEVGQPAQRDPSGTTIQVRPTLEIISIAANAVFVTVRNNSQPCQVTLQLFQPAIPST